MNKFINSDRSVIVAADVSTTGRLVMLASAVKEIPGISGVKLGIEQGLDSLFAATRNVRDNCLGSVIVYDHQKAGNDIPKMGAKFANKLKSCGVDAAILFPFAGPSTQRAWTEACVGEGLRVLIGGMMTHPQFLHCEGGYIADDTPERIYKLGIEQGVTDFVMPGNKLDWVERITGWLTGGLGADGYDSYAPGFITQKGDISECGKLIRGRFHAIVGSAIYGEDKPATPDEMRAAAMLCTSKLAA